MVIELASANEDVWYIIGMISHQIYPCYMANYKDIKITRINLNIKPELSDGDFECWILIYIFSGKILSLNY